MPARFRPNRLIYLVLLAALGATTACHGRPSPTPAVGTRALSFGSSGLAQAVVGQIWYPAKTSSHERTVFYSSMVWGHAAPNAAPAEGSARPLILLAHGWRGTRFDLSWLGEALARQGYVAAAINMPESDAQTFETAQAPKTWFRANLLSKLIDAVGNDPTFSKLVDTQNVAVIGHSAGGSTALMMAGATLDPSRFAKLFPASAPVVEGDWRDARVHALVALNPGTGPAFAPDGLAHVHVPVLILSGTGDNVAPEEQNAGFYAGHIEKASWTRFVGVDHYSFVSVCSPWGLLRGFGTCIESHPQHVDRRYVHAVSLTRIEDFLSRAIGKEADAAGLWPSIVPKLSPVAAHTPAAPSRR